MNNEAILENIFLEVTSIDFRKSGKLKNLNLFGSKLNVMPIYLVLVLLDIERTLGICFEEEDILNGRFDTFNDILLLINRESK